MARLESLQKAGYYKTPPSQVEAIAHDLWLRNYWGPLRKDKNGNEYRAGVINIYDPCCGDGEALAILRNAFSAVSGNSNYYATYGTEIDAERLEAAKRILDGAIQGDGRTVTLWTPQRLPAVVDILFLNPPYDADMTGQEDNVRNRRTELAFLDATLGTLRQGGLLIFIVPEKLTTDERYVSVLKAILEKYRIRDVTVRRFQEDEYDAFNQVVLIGKREVMDDRHWRPSSIYYSLTPDSQWRIGQTAHKWQNRKYTDPPVPKEIGRFSQDEEAQVNTDVILEYIPPATATSTVVENPGFFETWLGRPGEILELAPAQPLSPERAMLLAAGGFLNGLEVDGQIVRGHSFKKVVVVDTENEDGIAEKWEIEELVHQLTLLNLATGDVRSANAHDHPLEYERLITSHASAFLSASYERYAPRYGQAQQDKYFPILRTFKAPKLLPGQKQRGGLVPAQMDRAAVLLTAMETNGVVTMVGEMSVGKTFTSLAAMWARVSRRKPSAQKLVIFTPPGRDVIEGWLTTVRNVLDGVLCEEVRTIPDVIRLMDHPGPAVLIMPETMAKRASGWRAISLQKRFMYRAVDSAIAADPDAFAAFRRLHQLPDSFEDTGKRTTAGKHVYRYPSGRVCPQCHEAMNPDRSEAKPKCPKCYGPLWQWESTEPNKRGEKELAAGAKLVDVMSDSRNRKSTAFPLAEFLSQRYGNRYHLIIDEAHHTKSRSTNIGYATQDIVSGAIRTLQMTGTSYNGFASSVFMLLYRSSPQFRQLYGYKDEQKFVNAYGLMEKVTRWYPVEKGHNASGYREYVGSPSQRPGVHPAMVGLFLGNTAYLMLADMEVDMPPYSEHTLFVEWDDQLDTAANFLSKLKDKAGELARKKDFSLRAQYNQARFRLLDAPLTHDSFLNGELRYVPPAILDDYLFTKEEAFLRLVLSQKERGRPVLCFVSQIHRGDPTIRLRILLDRYGLRGVTMYDSEKERLKFIRGAIADGADVIFTSAGLVKEGIDIIETPTIIWWGVEYNIVVVTQANRRPFRLTQDREVEIYYLAYQGAQADAMDHVATKVAGLQTIQGQVVNGLAALRSEHTFAHELMELVTDVYHVESELTVDSLPPLYVWRDLEPEPESEPELEPETNEVPEVSPEPVQRLEDVAVQAFLPKNWKARARQQGVDIERLVRFGMCPNCMLEFQSADVPVAVQVNGSGPIYWAHSECVGRTFREVDLI